MNTRQLRCLAIATSAVIFTSCGDKGTVVDIPAGTKINEVLALDLYVPFDRDQLLSDPEATYGEPKDSGSESEGKDYVFFKEYVGQHGRIRIYDEAYQGEQGFETAQWLEVFPGGLYLSDVIRPEFLEGIDSQEGEWKLYLGPPNRSWYLTVELEGKAITRIVDHGR